MYEEMYNIDNLYQAFRRVRKSSGWKYQTQCYEENLLFNLTKLSNELKNKTYKPKLPNIFMINERGKERMIESRYLNDKIVQELLVNRVLLPIVRPKLIYDNSASLKMRGTDFFNRRLLMKVRKFRRKHGTNGYILKGDFTKYFDNLSHEHFLNSLKKFGVPEDILEFVRYILTFYKKDVSYMSDEEITSKPFNALKYAKIPKELLTGKKFINKSMGIGDQLSQLAGIIGAHTIDNYAKIVCGIKNYGRYMDDFYAISTSKEQLKELLDYVRSECKRLGMYLNEDKTQITPLRKGFTILKKHYVLSDNGVYFTADKSIFRREKRKLKLFRVKLDKHKMTALEISNLYISWKNTQRYCKSVANVDKLYDRLLISTL